jgi:peptide/nickel transport system substrate-binding protein
MHWKRTAVFAAVVMLAVTACADDPPAGAPATSPTTAPATTPTTTPVQSPPAADAVTDRTAKGPARPVDGATKGGIITAYAEAAPATLDPSGVDDTDGRQIQKLYLRALTQYDLRDGKPVLVPDLAQNLGTRSPDGLTWTFRLKSGIKYQDGTPVKAEHIVYAVKRSFVRPRFASGPSYHLDFLAGADEYDGPYGPDGENYSGVEALDDYTVVFHLARPFDALPFFASYPMFAPIPKERDRRSIYQLTPMSTGPYQVASHEPGKQLRLTTNPNWNPDTDPVRHQYADGFVFHWGGDPEAQQRNVLDGAGADANALHYGAIEPAVVPQIDDTNRSQLVVGDSPCLRVVTMDTQRIPLPVRKAIAVAMPWDALRAAEGLAVLTSPPASTLQPPAVLGYAAYRLPGLTGTGPGNPVRAKQLLVAAGQDGFELSWYYAEDDPLSRRVSQIRELGLAKAGFSVRARAVPTAKLRGRNASPNAKVNMLRSPAAWCADWPTGSSWFPELFTSAAVDRGTSMGRLRSPALDAEIARIAGLGPAEQLPEWARLDRTILSSYLPVLPYQYMKAAFVVGRNIGHAVCDPTAGMPDLTSMYLQHP